MTRLTLIFLTVCLVFSVGPLMMTPQQTLADDSRSELELLLQEFVLEALRDRQVVHPTEDEREAVTTLLAMRPRPNSLSRAEVTFLRSLAGDRIWTGGEERTLHKIWKDVTGKSWPPSEN